MNGLIVSATRVHTVITVVSSQFRAHKFYHALHPFHFAPYLQRS